MSRQRLSHLALASLLGVFLLALGIRVEADTNQARALLEKIGVQRGICVLLGDSSALSIPLAQQSELTIFVQLSDADAVAALRRRADAAGLLGTRLYVQQGDYRRLHLVDNLADAVVTTDPVSDEVMRILRPGGKALAKDGERVKPMPANTDEWTHPYHGPDNNPQSTDQVARRPFMTHFLAEPWYCPLTQMTVISGGRMFKAFGDRSSAKPQEPLLGQLLAMNAFNGTILWMRDLSPGFMIHRNTMIATPQTLYLADDKSCKLIDAATGKVRDEIIVPEGVSDGPVWKWMALENNILVALVGEKEPPEITARGDRIRGAGWPWWKYNNYSYGFGRTLIAFDPATKRVLWHHREKDLIDGRAVTLRKGKLYFYGDRKFLACLDAKNGQVLWKNSDADLLEAIGPHGQAQHPLYGFASTAYMKCSDDVIFFAGPQRPRIVGASTKDGQLLWQHDGGNAQLVLRQDGLYALGQGRINSVKSSMKLDPLTGRILSTFPSRDRCTRATGCFDSIFTRGGAGGSTAVFDVRSTEPKMGLLSPMRPACTDGVTVAHGYLFWGPWMCACDQTQIGVISLGPAPKKEAVEEAGRLQGGAGEAAAFPVTAADWPVYRRDNSCSAVTGHAIAAEVKRSWLYEPPHRMIATAPTAANGLIFVSGADGIVRALEADTGKPRWTAYTGGPVKYPPALWNNRAYVGSGDGWVYCFEAASGKQLWRFRAAPTERIMPVYGSLASTWPVGSGVLVHDGVVYAAAGIFNYDGTHVYALDALTGKVRWVNSTSGSNSPEGSDIPDAGVSVQGHLLLHDSKIWMPAGNRPTVAAYAVADGKFTPSAQGRGKHLLVRGGQVKATGFPLYWRPDDDHFLSPMELETPAGVLAINAARLSRLGPQGDPKKPAWSTDLFHEIAGLAVGKNAVVVAGTNRNKKGEVTDAGVCAVDLVEGKVLWREELPAAPVAWGVALDRTGRIAVTLVDGRVAAFEKK